MNVEGAPLSSLSTRLSLRCRPIASTSSGLFVSYILAVAIGIVTSRLLGPSSKGLVAAVTSWTQVLMWVSAFGLNTAVSVRTAEADIQPDGKHALAVSLGNSLLYSALVGSTVAIAALVILSNLLSDLGNGTALLLSLSLVGLPAGILSSILLSMQLSLHRSFQFTIAQISGPAISALILSSRYVASGRLTGVDVIGAALASTLGVLVILAKGLPWKESRINRHTLLADLKFGGKTAVGGIASLVNLRLDILVLSILLSSVDVGLYSAANNMMAPVLLIPSAAAVHLLPSVARRPEDAETTRFIFSEAYLFTGLSAIGGLLLAAGSPFVVPFLLGQDYQPVVQLIWILIPGFIARGFSSLLVAGAIGHRQPKVGNLAELSGVVVTVVALPVALIKFGVLGAACVSSASYIASAATAATVLHRIKCQQCLPA